MLRQDSNTYSCSENIEDDKSCDTTYNFLKKKLKYLNCFNKLNNDQIINEAENVSMVIDHHKKEEDKILECKKDESLKFNYLSNPDEKLDKDDGIRASATNFSSDINMSIFESCEEDINNNNFYCNSICQKINSELENIKTFSSLENNEKMSEDSDLLAKYLEDNNDTSSVIAMDIKNTLESDVLDNNNTNNLNSSLLNSIDNNLNTEILNNIGNNNINTELLRGIENDLLEKEEKEKSNEIDDQLNKFININNYSKEEENIETKKDDKNEVISNNIISEKLLDSKLKSKKTKISNSEKEISSSKITLNGSKNQENSNILDKNQNLLDTLNENNDKERIVNDSLKFDEKISNGNINLISQKTTDLFINFDNLDNMTQEIKDKDNNNNLAITKSSNSFDIEKKKELINVSATKSTNENIIKDNIENNKLNENSSKKLNNTNISAKYDTIENIKISQIQENCTKSSNSPNINNSILDSSFTPINNKINIPTTKKTEKKSSLKVKTKNSKIEKKTNVQNKRIKKNNANINICIKKTITKSEKKGKLIK